MHGMIQTAHVLQSHGLSSQYAMEQSSYIAVNREKLVRRFLKTDCQFFMFIDADTAFTAGDVLALLAADVPIVSGLYRYRTKVTEGGIPHCFRDPQGKPIDVNSNELQECGFLPTGMLLIRREVFEKMYRQHEYVFDQGFKDMSWFKKVYDFADETVQSDFEGEDIHFSRLWRDMGGKLYVKADVKVGHVGVYNYNEF
jgi:hypothetical protein